MYILGKYPRPSWYMLPIFKRTPLMSTLCQALSLKLHSLYSWYAPLRCRKVNTTTLTLIWVRTGRLREVE